MGNLFNNKLSAKKIHSKPYNKYGAISDINNEDLNMDRKMSHVTLRQLMISVFAFGLIQFVSHFTYFMGYLETATTDHYEIAPLFNSFAICLAFLWSYCVYKLSINGEVILYLFLMYVGVVVCGYSFIKYGDGFDLLLRTSNIYLIISAFLESLSLILIKYANR